ncbi:MAG TPA: manganese efflux pump MntP family protein [Polyangiaceae bacterium]
MNALAILTLSVGLAMDATAVSAARGCAARAVRAQDVLRVALLFGGFQALMPGIGWLVGESFGSVVSAWDHWIAFALLGAIGGKMLWEAREAADPATPAGSDPDLFATHVLVVLAIATSIDALAAGITLPILGAPMLFSLASIGLITAVLSALGMLLGRRFGGILGRRLDAFGGVVLVGLGTKILVEHLALV